MIFEFFKRLFWKADEETRKRKINVDLQSSSNSESFKKRCYDVISNNHIKVTTESDGLLRKNMHLQSQLRVSKKKLKEKKDDIQVKALDASLRTIGINDHQFYTSKSILQPESLNQFTLTKTKKLSEKGQYNQMLFNFIPTDASKLNNRGKNILENRTLNSFSKISSKDDNTKINVPICHSFKFNKTSNHSYYHSYSSQETVNKDILITKLQNKNEINENALPKIIKNNSLREVFSTKKVTKANFISEIAKKYDQRLEHRCNEVQEIKKITYLLSRHNQFTREAVLENYLNKSLKLCEAVLDEKESELPELNSEMIQKIKLALSKGPVDEILVESFGLRITKRDIQTLAGLNWLNDEIINFYMNLLIMRGSSQGFSTVYAMNTFFYPKLLSGGHASLKRWTRKVDIFSKNLIVIPVHLGIHWCLSVIDFRKKTIKYYDSMGSPNNKCLQALKQYLIDEYNDKKQAPFDFSNWIFECEKNIPQQMNGSDCGVFSCMFAEYICADKNLNFSQDDMPYFRNKMIYEIINVKLL